MTSEPHTVDPDAAPARRARIALALTMEGLSLMERTPVGWVKRAENALNEEDFSLRMEGLRDEALAIGGGAGVEVWLPAEQVLTLRVTPEGPGPGPLRKALAAATPHPLDELVWDTAETKGVVAVAATWRRTVREAREFAEKWSLSVTRVTTRAADADFPEGPVFEIATPAAPPAPRKPVFAIATAGALAALGLAVWLWPSGSPDLPNPAPNWSPPTAMSARTDDSAAIPAPASAEAPAATATAPTVPDNPAPLVERPPSAEPQLTAPPRAVSAEGLGGGDPADDAPTRNAADGVPAYVEPPAAETPPAQDQAATIVQDVAPPDDDAPPRVRLAARLAPDSPPAAAPDVLAEADERAKALTSVSVLAETPKGLADETPPPEVLGTEFSPPPAPAEPEDVEDVAEEETAATAPAPEVPPQFIAGPETPRPPPKPGDETAVVTPPVPPERPETEAQPSLAPEAPVGENAPSTHALAVAPRPLPKPVSAKDLAEAEGLAPTSLASLTAPRPGLKPSGLKLRAGALATARAKARDEARAASKAASTKSGQSSRRAPASASLSAATTRDAVDLSDTILVGVFGASSSRRAILRLPNGDMRRVKNGETVDGWKVASIGQSSIKLTKSGKNRTLNVPGE